MGRRSTFPRRAADFYPTPVEALRPLVPHLPRAGTYAEPCVGDGALVRGMAAVAPGWQCVATSDLHCPVRPRSAALVRLPEGVDAAITNPPWPAPGQRGEPVLGIIHNLAAQAPTWLLLPWTFAAARYFAGVSHLCTDVLPIGRVSWMGNGVPSKDDAAWFRFEARARRRATALHARVAA